MVEFAESRAPVLSIFAADGAGSATAGGEGAKLAIQAAAELIRDKLIGPKFVLGTDLAAEVVTAIRKSICARAEQVALKAREFACTFLGVLSSDENTLIMQIGDGGIVLDVGNGLEVPIIPMSGEYANMTHFITDDDAAAAVVSRLFPARALRVAAFTDGIQRLALNMATNSAHEPFFAPFFKVLAAATAAEEEQLQYALVAFLNSAAVNERTDDDKTLALAVLVE